MQLQQDVAQPGALDNLREGMCKEKLPFKSTPLYVRTERFGFIDSVGETDAHWPHNLSGK
jgi:hypothetical protein